MNYLDGVVNEFEAAKILSPNARELLPELVRFLPDVPAKGQDTFSILDVGSGPTTRLGTTIKDECNATVIAMDSQADEYSRLLRQRNLQGLTEPLQLRAEDAGDHFQPGEFDLIFLRNVIHELDDPRETVRNLLPLLRPGCSLTIYNVTDERLSRYGLSPRWNIEFAEDDLVVERNGHSVSLCGDQSGVVAKSYHQNARSFARLRLRRPGLNWREVRAEWEEGKKETMFFWSGRAANPDGFPSFKERFNADQPLREGIAKYLPLGAASVNILDVGSGPATNIGHTMPGREVRLTCIDVMAEPFNELMADAGLQAPVPPIYGNAEDVDSQFAAGSFDIVFSRNALDHVADPLRALQGMLAVTNRDGCVIVWGHVNEGENENYHGYHQWNFCWEEDDFVVWRPGFRQSVRALFNEKVYLHSEGTEDFYRIVISRRPIAA